MAKTPMQDDNDQIVTDEEAKRKGDAGLLRALRTPHKPHAPLGKRNSASKPRDKKKASKES